MANHFQRARTIRPKGSRRRRKRKVTKPNSAKARHRDRLLTIMDGEQNGISARAARVPETSAAKVGRNEPCPCGSGSKYKRCCW